jgi:formate dehydrogenase major subunit
MIRSVAVNDDGTLGAFERSGRWNEAVSIAIDNDRCIRCGQCHEVCPMDCISVTRTELVEIDVEQ